MSNDIPVRLRELLGGVGARLGLEDPRATALVWSGWSQIVGEAVARNAEPTSLKNGVLRIRASSPAWAQELTYLGPEIRSRANELTGSETVREVRAWTGPGGVAGATSERARGGQDGPDERPPADPAPDLPTAFERARAAWARRRSSGP